MEKFCASPWNHININNRGQVKPCCLFVGGRTPDEGEDLFEWYKTAYNDVKELQMEHPGCVSCKKAEQANIESRRMFRGSLGANSNNITYLDISFGNTCNLKCRMCESRNSTKWIADEIYLEKEGFNIDREIFKKYDMSESRLKQVVDYCNNVAEEDFVLEIKGGEPFVTDSFLNFIDMLSDEFKKKTELRVFTNGTTISDYYIEKLKPFKKIRCNLSVEATGKLYNYIRGGNTNTLDQAIKFMGKLESNLNNLVTGLSVTITLYNIFDLDDLVNKISEYKVPDKRLFSNFSYNPKYLDPGIIPFKYKKRLSEKYKNIDVLQPFIKYLYHRPSSPELMRKFKEYTVLLDKKRNENLLEIVPEFKELFDAI